MSFADRIIDAYRRINATPICCEFIHLPESQCCPLIALRIDKNGNTIQDLREGTRDSVWVIDDESMEGEGWIRQMIPNDLARIGFLHGFDQSYYYLPGQVSELCNSTKQYPRGNRSYPVWYSIGQQVREALEEAGYEL